MKARHLYLLLLITIGVQDAMGQVYGGIKLGYALSFSRPEVIKYDDPSDFLTYKMTFIEQDVSPGFSCFARIQKDLVFLQAEVGYRIIKTRFSSVNFLEPGNLQPVETIKRTGYLRVPLSAGVRLDRFYFGAGPVFSYIIAENRIFADIENLEERRRDLDSGFQFTFAVTMNRLQVDLGYEYQFNGVADYLYYRKDNKSFTRQSRLINLGLSFLF